MSPVNCQRMPQRHWKHEGSQQRAAAFIVHTFRVQSFLPPFSSLVHCILALAISVCGLSYIISNPWRVTVSASLSVTSHRVIKRWHTSPLSKSVHSFSSTWYNYVYISHFHQSSDRDLFKFKVTIKRNWAVGWHSVMEHLLSMCILVQPHAHRDLGTQKPLSSSKACIGHAPAERHPLDLWWWSSRGFIIPLWCSQLNFVLEQENHLR